MHEERATSTCRGSPIGSRTRHTKSRLTTLTAIDGGAEGHEGPRGGDGVLLQLSRSSPRSRGGLELTDVDHVGGIGQHGESRDHGDDGAEGIGADEGEGLTDLIELLVGELTWLLLHGAAGHLSAQATSASTITR